MYEATVVITVVLMVVSALDYVRRAWKGETNPVPATWILMMVMMGLSFWMYWMSPKKSLTANIGVTIGVVNVAIVLIGVIATNIRYGTLRIAFDATQKWCLTGGGTVVLFWSLTSQPLISYILVQCIAILAYTATIKRLWKAESITEPYFIWGAALLGSLSAIYPAWVRNDPFAWIYLARSIPSTIVMMWLIARIKRRMRQSATLSA